MGDYKSLKEEHDKSQSKVITPMQTASLAEVGEFNFKKRRDFNNTYENLN